jgi:hypothetical protein
MEYNNMSIRDRTVVSTELAYYKSVYTDSLRFLLKDREAKRKELTERLRNIYPRVSEDTLSNTDIRLLRLSKVSPSSLTKEERKRVQAIRKGMDRMDNKCINLTPQKEGSLKRFGYLYTLQLPDIAPLFGYSIKDLLEQGYTNHDYNLVDVPIEIGKETYSLPLTREESEVLLGHILTKGWNIDKHPQLPFPDLDKVVRKIEKKEQKLKVIECGLRQV